MDKASVGPFITSCVPFQCPVGRLRTVEPCRSRVIQLPQHGATGVLTSFLAETRSRTSGASLGQSSRIGWGRFSASPSFWLWHFGNVADSAPAESRGDVGQNGLHDMDIVGNTQLVRHS